METENKDVIVPEDDDQGGIEDVTEENEGKAFQILWEGKVPVSDSTS